MPGYDPFELDEGGSDYIATTTYVEFKAGEYNFQAVFTNKYDEPREFDGEIKTERPEFVTIGSNDQWMAVDGGRGFKHVSKTEPKIRANSQYGELLARAVQLVGKDTLGKRGTPFEAQMWEGLTFHWKTEGAGRNYKFTDKVTGEVKEGKTNGRQMPVEFLGEGAPVEAFDVASLALAPDQQTFLEDAANSADSLGAFQAAVMPWMHKGETGLSGAQKDALTKLVAGDDGWKSLRTAF